MKTLILLPITGLFLLNVTYAQVNRKTLFIHSEVEINLIETPAPSTSQKPQAQELEVSQSQKKLVIKNQSNNKQLYITPPKDNLDCQAIKLIDGRSTTGERKTLFVEAENGPYNLDRIFSETYNSECLSTESVARIKNELNQVNNENRVVTISNKEFEILEFSIRKQTPANHIVEME